MEKLLSSAVASHETVPGRFLLPPEQLPAAAATPVSLPVIHFSGGRDEVRRAVLRAGKELGFFQVVNHGVPERTMRELGRACGEFFRLPAADKVALYSEDTEQTNRLFSSTMYVSGGQSYWRDCLRLACYPVESTKPGRPALEDFIIPARSVGMDLLRLLCEGIGLLPDYFEGDLSGGEVILNANHYPACPDPSVALGLPPHCDRNLITVLLQPGYVCGLQVSYHGGWIDVEPIPDGARHQLRPPAGDRHQRAAPERGVPGRGQRRRGEDVRSRLHHANNGLRGGAHQGARRRGQTSEVPERRLPRLHAQLQALRRPSMNRGEEMDTDGDYIGND